MVTPRITDIKIHPHQNLIIIVIPAHFGPFTRNSGYTGHFMHIIAYKYDIYALYLLILVRDQDIEVFLR